MEVGIHRYAVLWSGRFCFHEQIYYGEIGVKEKQDNSCAGESSRTEKVKVVGNRLIMVA